MRRQIRDQILNIMVSVKKGLAYFQVSNKYIVLKKCIQALQSVEQLCQNGFSKTRADYYNQGFSMIIDKLSQQLITQQNMAKFDCDAFIKSLDIISARLSNDKEVKKEIIFLPYKASMWDSLESIWQAAAADKENCDAYVIPIPYCDRNPDGSAAQWHCEADQFPSYVPITDYREYNIAKHRPDVIYIHNPYDGYNRVTSVDSSYYSSELKKYTNMLVYVPYFVSGPAVSEDICQAPGIVMADHVIVESEKIKKQYETYYPGGNPPKDKFLALGSPKFDKVLSSKKEDFVLPDNWEKIINGRKIILYNTSLGAMLENSGRVNAKLRYVFSVFKERKDVVLWWRPHPLMKATMESMRPEILQEYEQIEQEYKNEAWGIYDDTAELDRAITWSDAYYGDMSSVVWLYKVTGKSLLIQDLNDGITYRHRRPLIGMGAEPDETGMWTVSYIANVLFHLNKNRRIVDKMYFLPEIPNGTLVTTLVRWEKYLYLAPYNAKEFWRFDIEKGIFYKIELGLSQNEKACNQKFANITLYNDKLYLFARTIDSIFIYDCRRDTCKRIDGCYEPLKGRVSSWTGFNSYKTQMGDKLYLMLYGTHFLMEFDLSEEKYNWYQIGDRENERFFALAAYQDDIILTNEISGAVIWNPKYGIIRREQYFKFEDSDHNWSGSCWYCYVHDDIIVYFPATYPVVLYQHIGENTLKQINYRTANMAAYPDGVYAKLSFNFWSKDTLCFQNSIDGLIYCYDFQQEKLSRIEINLTNKQILDICQPLLASSLPQDEGIIDLPLWIQHQKKANSDMQNMCTEISAGNSIYNTTT
ncbi:hypothetical protein [Pectinatus frisingensis]|uniref:hypothetical protein n=1 Tax=Pectinatus frisingensis TaxID=865 RepID=UPI0018C771DE|nr:hypothetical protein [Pectinatus frisingensis]